MVAKIIFIRLAILHMILTRYMINNLTILSLLYIKINTVNLTQFFSLIFVVSC